MNIEVCERNSLPLVQTAVQETIWSALDFNKANLAMRWNGARLLFILSIDGRNHTLSELVSDLNRLQRSY